MGASDSLMTNRSTFQLELYETSEILKLATRKSLIILDELGRGTSTNDGEAIASATLEFISLKKKSLCVFVTHYPGLASLTKVSFFFFFSSFKESKLTKIHFSCHIL